MQYGIPFRFSDVSEKELNTFIQKAVPEKCKISTKYGIKIFESLTVSFDNSHKLQKYKQTRLGHLEKVNIFVKNITVLLFLHEFLLKQLEYSLSISIAS